MAGGGYREVDDGEHRPMGKRTVMTRSTRRRAALMALVSLIASLLVFIPHQAQALSGSDFNPGYILSDSVFSNSSSMSEPQIQSFLEAQVPRCSPVAGVPCLRDYTSDSTTKASSPSGQCSAITGASAEPASRIISKVAQSCGVNPQVLLVLLQKEQGLVTATSPSASRYRIATGFGCPDTAPCDTQYYGFFNQLYKAAWQLREYTIHPSSWRYKVGNNAIQYSPNASCGAPVINVTSQATANLYNYTPYQPNAAALANLTGVGDGCSAYGNRNFWVYFSKWFGSPIGQVDPVANLESASILPGVIRVSGWAYDPDTTASIPVHVYVNGVGTAFTADTPRADVGAATGAGPNHGFDISLPVQGTGEQNVCVYAIDAGPGANVLMGCDTLQPPGGSPRGVLEQTVVTGGTIAVSGWALDPDTISATTVHIYVDSASTAYTANAPRADVGAVFPGYGPEHGFSETITADPGAHNICVYAINVGVGDNILLGCKNVTVGTGLPFGNIESVSTVAGSISSSGWAIDPDTGLPIPVHLYVDGASTAFLANQKRPDVASAYAPTGNLHGFSTIMPATPGSHRVCLYAINIAGPGGNPLLGCSTVTTPAAAAAPADAKTGSPFGNLESLVISGGIVRATGWAIDPDVTTGTSVRIVTDGRAAVYPAVIPRPDVGSYYAGMGANHGFDASTTVLAPGPHQVCVFAVNFGAGSDTELGCRTVGS